MLPLSSPRNRRPRRASLPLLAAVLLGFILSDVRGSPPAGRKCPPPLDCAKEGRHFCKHGSFHCGPCLDALVENEEGGCVVKKRNHATHGKMAAIYTDEDEAIDFLHSVIAKQEESPIKPKQQHVNKVKPHASKPKQKSQSPPVTKRPSTTATTSAPQTTSTQHNAEVIPGTSSQQGGRAQPVVVPSTRDDAIIVVMISLCIIVGTMAVILASICFVRMKKESRLAQKVDYPAFGGTPSAAKAGTSV
ncbi:neural proliferation differentiation and control protein 1-like, partial [Genypterus blacodes]|uniref:neural proliferation differentiation and control protein 1-like n=1 Tax=Genypterus blacodes TaxID=154954 RepID=UPI003F76D9EC